MIANEVASISGEPALLSVRDLACTVGLRPLFGRLSFDLKSGSWTRLTGPNGCGKSTLLRALTGLLRPTGGTVFWRGQPRRPGTAPWLGEMLYQGHASGWKDILTAAENLSLQLALDRGMAPEFSEIQALLSDAGLGRQAGLPFQRLSAGQRHRLSLARLIASRQALWLLDEPTTALDSDGQRLFGHILETHLSRGGCALVATHLPIDCTASSDQIELAQFARQS